MASASEAVSVIQSNDRVYVHQGYAQPEPLIDAMIDRAGELRNVKVYMATMGSGRYTQSEYRESFRHNALFIGANVRGAV